MYLQWRKKIFYIQKNCFFRASFFCFDKRRNCIAIDTRDWQIGLLLLGRLILFLLVWLTTELDSAHYHH